MKNRLPNILTVARLFAAPLIAIVFLLLARPWADWLALFLFVAAALTDFLDGYLARRWKQESKLGAMLDPIADKAMVVIALTVIIGTTSLSREAMDPWIVLPAALILFREVFVSGLREFLGDTAGTLKVTKLAKWKTTTQMVAIGVLFLRGIFEHQALALSYGLGPEMTRAVMLGLEPDERGLRTFVNMMNASWWAGVALLWLAALLTLFTGWDYFKKSKPYLEGGK